MMLQMQQHVKHMQPARFASGESIIRQHFKRMLERWPNLINVSNIDFFNSKIIQRTIYTKCRHKTS